MSASFDPQDLRSFGAHRALGLLVARQCEASPRQVPFFARRFGTATAAELDLCEQLAQQILRLADTELAAFADGYNFLCDIQKKEEIHFRRHGTYRVSTIEQAIAEVYGNQPYMQRYMRGLLLSQVFWSNHTSSMRFYLEEFLARLPPGRDLLEIGPGHGLLLSRAVEDRGAHSVSAWDLSPASVAETREALHKLGVGRPYNLQVQNLLDAQRLRESFDAVVFSEVLEHLDQPKSALEAIHLLMRPNARLYINVPVNSPAPDHLFLLRSPEEAIEFVTSCGFAIQRTGLYPATNYSLEAARKHALTISVCMIATKVVA